MGNLSIKTQGIKGGRPQYKEKNGYVTTFLGHDDDRIIVDAYEGEGDSYKPREMFLIEIFQNGSLLFSGDKYELFQILRNNKQTP